MGAGSIRIPTGRSTLLKKAARRLWRDTAERPANLAGMGAPQSRIVAMLRFLPALESQSPTLARASYRLLCALFDGDRIDLARVHTEQIDIGQGISLSARVYVPETCLEGAEDPGLVYYHGGGCVMGDLDTHDVFCRTIAAGSRLPFAGISMVDLSVAGLSPVL